jgi:hypothetical protein
MMNRCLFLLGYRDGRDEAALTRIRIWSSDCGSSE